MSVLAEKAKRNWRKWAFLVGSVSLFSFAVGVSVYFIFGAANNNLSSDSLDTLLWAQAAYDAKGLVNNNFRYASLLPLGGHLLMVPFVAAFGVGLKAQMFGMLAFDLVLCASILFFFRSLRWSWPETMGAAAILLLTMMSSGFMRSLFFQHILYYSQGLVYLWTGLGLLLRAERRRAAQGEMSSLGGNAPLWLLCALLLLSAVNGTMTLALFSVPLLGAYLLNSYGRPSLSRVGEKRILWIFLVLALCVGLGYAGNRLLSAGNKTSYADGVSSFANAKQWAPQMVRAFVGWIRMATEPSGEFMVMSPDGMMMALCMVVAIAAFLIPLAGARRLTAREQAQEQMEERYVTLVFLILSAVVLFLFVFTKYGEAEWRVLPMLLFAVTASLVTARGLLKGASLPGKRVGGAILALFILFAAKCGYVTVKMPVTYRQHPNVALTDFLLENDLSYGFATYWNAISPTVYANSRVKIRPVKLQEKLMTSIYQTNAHWYENQPGVEKYFLMLTKEELETSAHSVPADPTDTLQFNDYTIFVYDHNLFAKP